MSSAAAENTGSVAVAATVTARLVGSTRPPRWLDKQTAKLLPIEHFLITFTVPWELRRVVRANQEVCYDAMFQCGSQTIRELASNPKWLGTSKLGFFGVLQTWGRDLTVYHPHIHFVVPGGGVSEDGNRWLSTAAGFFFPEAVCLADHSRQDA